jgi:hypothetical protein
MRATRFRSRLWLAGALSALTAAGACDLNPQPLPPLSGESASGDDGSAAFPTGGSPSSSGAGSGSGGLGGSGFGPPAGTTPGSGPRAAADAGAIVSEDAAEVERGDATIDAEAEGGDAAIDAAVEAGTPIDSGTEEPPADAANDGGSASDAACVRPRDCSVNHPGKCFHCAWPLNLPVCVEGRCACACEGGDAAEER